MVSNPAPGPGDQTGDPAAGRVPALLGDRPGRCLGAEPLVSGAYRLAFHAHGDQAVTVTGPISLTFSSNSRYLARRNAGWNSQIVDRSSLVQQPQRPASVDARLWPLRHGAPDDATGPGHRLGDRGHAGR